LAHIDQNESNNFILNEREKERNSRFEIERAKYSIAETSLLKEEKIQKQLEDTINIEVKELSWIKNLTETAKFYKYSDSKNNPQNKFLIRSKKVNPERYSKPVNKYEENSIKKSSYN